MEPRILLRSVRVYRDHDRRPVVLSYVRKSPTCHVVTLSRHGRPTEEIISTTDELSDYAWAWFALDASREGWTVLGSQQYYAPATGTPLPAPSVVLGEFSHA